jgi:1,2-diacylglycerol 3-alpha-glucosyltransferase
MAFQKIGHNVTLVAASEYKPVTDEHYEFEIVFIKSALKKLFLPNYLPFQPGLIAFLIREQKDYDFIVSSENFAFPSLFAAMICPKKTIIWQEMNVHQKKWRKIPSKFWLRIVVPLFMSRVKTVIPRSHSAYEFVSKYFRQVSSEVIDHGVNVENFHPVETKKRQFVVVSQLIPRKNIESIIHKFGKLIADNQFADFVLAIAGKGELEDKLKMQVKQMAIENNVRFAGFLSHHELNSLVADSMAMLIDTKQDLNMVSIPESIASGTPVVTNLIPASASYIADNRLGIAKADWNETDLKDMIANNSFYVANCIAYREKLTNVYLAKQMMDIAQKRG